MSNFWKHWQTTSAALNIKGAVQMNEFLNGMFTYIYAGIVVGVTIIAGIIVYIVKRK